MFWQSSYWLTGLFTSSHWKCSNALFAATQLFYRVPLLLKFVKVSVFLRFFLCMKNEQMIAACLQEGITCAQIHNQPYQKCLKHKNSVYHTFSKNTRPQNKLKKKLFYCDIYDIEPLLIWMTMGTLNTLHNVMV